MVGMHIKHTMSDVQPQYFSNFQVPPAAEHAHMKVCWRQGGAVCERGRREITFCGIKIESLQTGVRIG